MSSPEKSVPGAIVWFDLTVPQADAVRDFYSAVVGWQAQPVDMGGYDDFNMLPPGSEIPAAGICYARGVNADLPPQWLLYVVVADLDASLTACEAGGGRVVAGPKDGGDGSRLAVIADPAGAVIALYQVGDPPAA